LQHKVVSSSYSTSEAIQISSPVDISQGRKQLAFSHDNTAQTESCSSGGRQRHPREDEHNGNSSSVATQRPRNRRILTPPQAADLLGCDDKTITRWSRKGYIPAHPMGEGKKKYWRFFEDELIDWLMGQTNGALAA
jgi:excisionase family DNA binding protein